MVGAVTSQLEGPGFNSTGCPSVFLCGNGMFSLSHIFPLYLVAVIFASCVPSHVSALKQDTETLSDHLYMLTFNDLNL